jgi:hypothetical protein
MDRERDWMGMDLPLYVTFRGLNIPLEWERAVEVDVRNVRCTFVVIGNDVENLVFEEAASDNKHRKVRPLRKILYTEYKKSLKSHQLLRCYGHLIR